MYYIIVGEYQAVQNLPSNARGIAFINITLMMLSKLGTVIS